MRPHKKVITELFNERSQYLIPLFQRGYVWTLNNHVDPLWQDLIERVDALDTYIQDTKKVGENKLRPLRKHFLGTIVVTEAKGGSTNVINAREVIDGQQRLTTLQILLLAFRDVVKSLADDTLNEMLKPLIVNTGRFTTATDSMKLMPTNVGREVMKELFKAGDIDKVCQQYPAHGATKRMLLDRPLMVKTYLYFYVMLDAHLKGHRFDDLIDPNKDQILSHAVMHSIEKDNLVKCLFPNEAILLEKAELFHNMLDKAIQVMYLELEEEDDPQIIFETLNARGAPLQPSDLIRNFIFLDATRKNASVDELYDNYWKGFDDRENGEGKQGSKFWRLEERQGRLKNTRLDLLLYHFVMLRKAKEFKVGHVFDEFKDWWNSEQRDAATELGHLTTISKHFETFLIPTQNTRFGLFCRRLKQLDTATVTPLVFYFLEHHATDSNEFIAVLDALESFIVRRFVCGLNTKSYTQLFVKILSELKTNKKITAVDLKAMLLTSNADSQRWPNDQEFEQAWLYRRLYIGRNTSKVRALLECLEQSQRTNKHEYLVLPDDLTIEHVMPQKWQTNWPFATGEETIESLEKRERLLHSIGNLTLVTGAFNSALSHSAFMDKRSEITNTSLLRLNAYFQQFDDASVWNEQSIVNRAEKLFESAKKVWPQG